MAVLMSDMVTALGRRMRDPAHLAHASADKVGLLYRCERIVCAATKAIMPRQAITYAPTVFPVHQISALNFTRIERVEYAGKALDHVPWKTLWQHKPNWLQERGEPRVWDMFGRRYVLIWPMPATPSVTVTLVGVRLTKTIDTINGVFELQEEHMPGVLSLAEQLLLLRQRLFASITPAAERAKADVRAGRAT